ncbi:hypothetical protein [Pseudomonas fluorescens]|uniref:Uncharacterized protein n=1 Tax=Pseudomonas fluorescens TaxID=294 RepID=A0A5E7EHI4_PSEFL|nr:hypothetical protein [Pseudomonas fluorescens]VVO26159.1 hypothetical protein PS691_04572 [Pseudomonas fluorescens]
MTSRSKRPDTDPTPEYPLSAPIDPRDPERKKTRVELEEEDMPESGVRVDEAEADPDDPDIAGKDGSGQPS